MTASKRRESWSSRYGFVMASIGFAVGLGNIWRFPYLTGEYGGAAFVLVYLLCAFGIGVPILMAEILIGRRGRLSPPGSMRAVAKQEGRSRHWRWVGAMNLLAAFLIEVVYSVITGWVLFYLYKAITTGFAGVDGPMAAGQFDALLASTPTMLFWTLAGLLLTGLTLYAGVEKGIEKVVIVLMPALFGLLVVLVIYNAFAGGFARALSWLFTPDFSKLNGGVCLAALGQAFFSIGVAMAAMMTYGSYLPERISIGQSVVMIVTADTLVALLAGMVVFPAVFANGLDPAAGTGLTFMTLPIAFARMPGGHLVGSLFFLLLSVAALTSMIGFVHPLTTWLEESRGYARHKSIIIVLIAIAVTSISSIASYNVLSDWKIMGVNLNAGLDFVANQVLLPVGGFLIAVFAGWFMSRKSVEKELVIANDMLFGIWYLLIRYAVPTAIATIFLFGII
ncbi:MAG: sodium-dependent transporter [Gammaproteobacteria bacterium]|nr:sodium-dependent transporter [Gammaproteobacteria bacterium]